MAEIWNSWEVKSPPVCTVKMVLFYKEVNYLRDTLFNVSKTMKNINYFHKECAILSRFLYKHKRMFRHDKGMQSLVKINQCLKRYNKLKFMETVNRYKETFPAKLQLGATHAYLPTRQMLKWVLFRLLSFSQLFKRIVELSKETACYFYQKLHLGWAFNISLFVFSLTARVLAASKYLLVKSIEWYNTMYKYLPYFELTAEFLPEFKFPVDLKKWLGDVDITPPKIKTSIDEIFESIDLVLLDDDKEVEEDDDIKIIHEKFLKSLFKTENTKLDSDIEEIMVEEVPDEIRGTKRTQPASMSEDLGVPVEDEDDIKILKHKSKKARRAFKKNF